MSNVEKNDSGLNLNHLEALSKVGKCIHGYAQVTKEQLDAVIALARRAAPVSAPTHCDPAECFCAACREQEKASRAAPIAGDVLAKLWRYSTDRSTLGKMNRGMIGKYVVLEDVRAALANQPAPTVPATHCAHVWNDFGQLGGRNVSWCPRCDVLAWTGKEPAHQPAPVQAAQHEADCRPSCGHIGAECDFPNCKAASPVVRAQSEESENPKPLAHGHAISREEAKSVILEELLAAPSLYSQVYAAAVTVYRWPHAAALDATDAACKEYGDAPCMTVESLKAVLDEVLRTDGDAAIRAAQEGQK